MLFVPPPDAVARAGIMDIHCQGKPTEDVDYGQIGKKTEGFSGADLKAVLDGGQADFTMTADLPRWWIDLAGEARLTDHPGAPTIPISVRGPIGAPTRTIETMGLESFLAQRVAETALRKLGGDSELGGAAGTVIDLLTGGTQQQQQPVEQEQQQEQVQPQDGGAVEAVPAAPEAPPEAVQVAPMPEEKPANENAAGFGNLLDLLTGGSGQQAEPEPDEPVAPDAEPTLDPDALLDLLQSLGN